MHNKNILSNFYLMSAIPPPPLPAHAQYESTVANDRIRKSVTPKIDECLWAENYPELQKACFLARICPIKAPAICEFYVINSILQVGPTCGLTALSMLLGGEPTPEHLLQDAQQKHYTNNGEMFSAHNLCQLICDYLAIENNNNNNNSTAATNNNKVSMCTTTKLDKSVNATDEVQERTNYAIDCYTHEGRLNCAKVRDELKAGAFIFVPYPFLQKNMYDVKSVDVKIHFLQLRRAVGWNRLIYTLTENKIDYMSVFIRFLYLDH